MSNQVKMDTKVDDIRHDGIDVGNHDKSISPGVKGTEVAEVSAETAEKKKTRAKSKASRRSKHQKGKRSKRHSKYSSDDSSSEDESEADTSSEETQSSSEDSGDAAKLRRLKEKLRAKKSAKQKKKSSKKDSRRKISSESEDSSPSESDTSDSESEEDRKKSRRKQAAKKSKKEGKKSKRHVSSSSDSSSDSSDSASESAGEESNPADDDAAAGDEAVAVDSGSVSDSASSSSNGEELREVLELQQCLLKRQSRLHATSRRGKKAKSYDAGVSYDDAIIEKLDQLIAARATKATKTSTKKNKKSKKRSKAKSGDPEKDTEVGFKRVDQIWDSENYDWKLVDSKEEQSESFDEYVFTVRRKFNWENKYQETVVDIKSKLLRDALSEIMKDVKGISLAEDKPNLDPNMLFLYLEELRTHYRKTLKKRLSKLKKRKEKKRTKRTIAHCKLLVKYLDEDYDATKKKLYPMLKVGNITFDLLWALFKPNTLAYTSTYGAWDHARCFKVDFANKESSFTKGEWYCIEGRYLEYDGKSFGLADFEANIEKFQGARKITSLTCYPLDRHTNHESVRKQLIERGKKFVDLAGMKYKFHDGLAFHKKKKTVFRFNINGRIMVDPYIFRRMLPNYPISILNPKTPDDDDDDANSDDESDCGCESDAEHADRGDRSNSHDKDGDEEKTKTKMIKTENGSYQFVDVRVDEDGKELRTEQLVAMDQKAQDRKFSDDELLLASPVVLGFAFSEKQWLEFTVSGVREIDWDEGAFESLVIPEERKSIVKALVSSHKFEASKTIDDVVQGKGKGLVFVLHGPPGVGKTLTAEGIAEYLKCPLYSVSMGELGTDSRQLEVDLQKVMDIAHSWGAVLLLDEADVFLEKRQHSDVFRNALVSIFLRLLEYFKGILFLTTNRVDTFDDAFQSRIHLPLRYEELSFKAKREIWRMFIEKVRTMEQTLKQRSSPIPRQDKPLPTSPKATIPAVSTLDTAATATDSAPSVASSTTETNPTATPASSSSTTTTTESSSSAVSTTTTGFSDIDLNNLARHNLNGRQIKNAVRTAQAIALNQGTSLEMKHIKQVLEVNEQFDRELKGGTGYLDAMRSYT